MHNYFFTIDAIYISISICITFLKMNIKYVKMNNYYINYIN